MNKNLLEFGFMISLAVMISSGVSWAFTEYHEQKDYDSRFYTQALSDFWLVQLYVYPFNDNDTVTLSYQGEHDEVLWVIHTEPNPGYVPMRFVYEYKIHFDRELTVEEVKYDEMENEL